MLIGQTNEECLRRREVFQDAFAAHGVNRCVIMTGSFRSGTSFIANILAKNGLPSLRNEKFSALRLLANDPDTATFAEKINGILATSTDGLFVSKIMWPHRNFLAFLLGYERSETKALAKLFPNARWINVIRQDKIGQAISFWKAKETNQWGRRNSADAAADPEYNFEKIRKCFIELSAHEILWRDFHALSGTLVQHVTYEDFTEHAEDLFPELIKWLDGHRIPSNELILNTSLTVQRNDHSDHVRQRFMSDLYRTGF